MNNDKETISKKETVHNGEVGQNALPPLIGYAYVHGSKVCHIVFNGVNRKQGLCGAFSFAGVVPELPQGYRACKRCETIRNSPKPDVSLAQWTKFNRHNVESNRKKKEAFMRKLNT